MFIRLVTLFIILAFPLHAGAEHKLDGSQLSLFWSIPFVGILMSLAILPLLSPQLWHHHFGKITLGWSLFTIAPIAYFFGTSVLIHELIITYVLHYGPFIILAGSLFIIAGGIRVTLRGAGRPDTNTITMAAATLIASFVGTTGAAMLFIRPMLKMNEWRRYKRHTMIFFILLVCNIGGCLTALGDPPLFLGFLFGVDFFWPTFNLFGPFLVVSIPLLLAYFIYDTYKHRQEDFSKAQTIPAGKKLIKVEGRLNVLLLGGVLASVLISGIWSPGIKIPLADLYVELQDLVRDLSLVLLSIISMTVAPKAPRIANQFTWEPLLEVVKIFAGIFITAAPVIVILDAGLKGELGSLISLVSNADGSPNNNAYFWMTGALSAFLDNAPTYMVFFYMAGGDPAQLMTSLNPTLIAISAGSVFMGALTYIGNAPNFMVKAIAESHRIEMPSFFGYMVWSILFLVPLFALLSWMYF